MLRFLLFILVTFVSKASFALSVSADIRREYAIKFHEAFVLQSTGETRRAYYCFKTAQQLAQKAGESRYKIQLMNDLFVWYRTYGYAMGVMSKESGCAEEYRSSQKMAISLFPKTPLARIPDYYSEWGNTPEQAALIREFMLGVGETIAGVFCVSVSGGLGTLVGGTLIVDGPRRMFVSLNNGWSDYERSCIEFKQLQEKISSLQNE